jgi:2-amino-4-hydroxy-6-hydroxymethyldihydropteridine diphosphokinase
VSGARARSQSLSPIVTNAAQGRLPDWASVRPARRAHMERVAELLDAWALRLRLPEQDRVRWRALAYLHDCLKEVPEDVLRAELRPPFDSLPGPVIHGPAAAARLAAQGVEDPELLDAVRYHTLGHPRLGPAGRALYAADFLEPGRDLRNEWRKELRDRMPAHMDAVVQEIVGARIGYLIGEGRPVRPETLAFWNSLAEGDSWVRASEL